MAISNRTVTIKNVFASTAETNIPNPPVPGQSYRNTNLTSEEVGLGWPFKEIVDSAKFNEAMYEYTTICQQLEKYGFLPWSQNTNYPAGGCALGTDGNVYQAKQPTGPSTTSVDPVNDTNHTYWDLFYYATVTANRALVSNGDGKVSASSTTATEIGYVHGVTSSLQTQINTKANTTDVVNLTGSQTISGTKTFTGGININTGNVYFKEGGVYNNGSPSTNQRFGTTHYMDSAGILRGFTHNYQGTNGDVVTVLNATNTTYSSNLLVGVKQNGTSYVQAPASDEVNSVVTTINKSKSENGYYKLGNGLIIQWGRYPSYVSPDPQSVTFPTPFTSTNYKAVCTYFRTGGDVDSGKDHINVDTQLTTGFTFRMSDTGAYGVNWIAIGY